MPVYLRALAVRNYRGVGPELQKMRSFRDFNFFIGANNAGKSTVLTLLSKYLGPTLGRERTRPTGLERYASGTKGEPLMAMGIPQQMFLDRVLAKINGQYRAAADKIVTALSDDGIIWVRFGLSETKPMEYLTRPAPQELSKAGIDRSVVYPVWHAFTNASGGSFEQHWVPDTLSQFLAAQDLSLPEVKLVPAIRQVGPRGEEFSDFSGRGLIDRIAEIQSPDHDKREERDLFDSINHFLQTVTGKASAQIEVPHNRGHILVHMDEKVLPLESLGTGIHEVIMIAAFCTLTESAMVCIEEPEIHLHPILQRKLVAYLQENTANQYFIATHSAAFIDTPDAAIFHVSNDGNQTFIRETILRSERFAICVDLGTRASDIVQSNSVIWVEGPSDRIYIRHWINAAAPELIEGIHYSIMFYGGRLLNHLTANDDEVTEFISLRALNQNLAVIMDSDRAAKDEAINGTKRRVQSEFCKGSGVAWITLGREIENYIDHAVLQEAVRGAHPGTYGASSKGGMYTHALQFRRADNNRIEVNVDKVKVAKGVCEHAANLDTLDLRERIEELVGMIRRANE